MQYVNVKFSGSKSYRDRTILRTLWEPGDVKSVPAQVAQQLRKFAEFSIVPGEATPNVEAMIVAQAKQREEVDVTENMLLAVEGWDKNQLEAYARQYQVELDKRRSLSSLRQEVANLVEQFGAM